MHTHRRLLTQTVRQRNKLIDRKKEGKKKRLADISEMTLPLRIHADFLFFLLCFGISIILRKCVCVSGCSHHKCEWREMLASARPPTHGVCGRAVSAATPSLSLPCHLLCHHTRQPRPDAGTLARMLTNKVALD